MKLFESLGIDGSYLVLGAFVGILVLFILLLVCLSKLSKMNKKYNAFMKGADGENLEATVLQRFREIDQLNEATGYLSEKLKIVNTTLLNTYQKIPRKPTISLGFYNCCNFSKLLLPVFFSYRNILKVQLFPLLFLLRLRL